MSNYGKTYFDTDGRPLSDHDEDTASTVARRVLLGTDPTLGWREAGYATAELAAEALVGHPDISADARAAAVEMVADQIRSA